MADDESAYRQEFTECLRVIASACADLESRGLPRPVIVGGAAVEYHTGGAIISGDFDVVTEWQTEFEDALVAAGFVREHRPGRLMRGLYHPKFGLGVEVVSGPLFDGLSDPKRLELVDVGQATPLAFAAVEDLIADRMGQYALDPRGMKDLLIQASMLYRLAENLDRTYLSKRIEQETAGQFDLSYLEEYGR